MPKKRFIDFPQGAFDSTKIILQSDPITGALQKTNLPAIVSQTYVDTGLGNKLDLIKKPIVTTVAGLRTQSVAADIMYQTTDNAGGQWHYDATDTTSTDNIGTVIVTAGGQRMKRIYSGSINVKWFGAVGLATTDDQPAIQAAINFAVSTQIYSVYIPTGNYKINSPIYITGGNNIKIFGDGKQNTWIRTNAAMNAAILFDTTIYFPGGVESYKNTFSGFTISCADNGYIVNYGILGTSLAHTTFERIGITGSRIAGLHAEYGWNNNLIDCEFSNNYGNGIELFNNTNSTLVIGCKIFGNGGFGAVVTGTQGLTFNSTTLEHNSMGGIYLINGGQNLTIENCYFEANAQTGLYFTNAGITVKADIILNGSSDLTGQSLENSYGVTGVSLKNNQHTATYMLDAIVFANSVDGLKIDNVNNNSPINPTVPLLGLINDSTFGTAKDVSLGNRKGCTPTYNILRGSITPDKGLGGSPCFWRDDLIKQNNLKFSLISYITKVTGNGGSISYDTQTFNGGQVMKAGGNVDSSDYYLFNIPITTTSYLSGQFVHFSFWVKNDATNTGIEYGQYSSILIDNNSLTTNWQFISSGFQMPASGTVQFGFKKIGTSTGFIYIAGIQLGLIGSLYDSSPVTSAQSNFSNIQVGTPFDGLSGALEVVGTNNLARLSSPDPSIRLNSTTITQQYLLQLVSGNGRFRISDDTLGIERFTILPNGNIGINNSSPASILDVAGNGNFSGTLTATSFSGSGASLAEITPTQIGLSNVNNTADAAKPISTLQQAGLDLKANIASPTFTTQVTTPLIYGSASSSGTLTVGSTSNATKGKILFGTSAYDEVNNRLGVGINPSYKLDVSDPTLYTTTQNLTVGNFWKSSDGGSSLLNVGVGGASIVNSVSMEFNSGAGGTFRYGTYVDANIVNNNTGTSGPYGNLNLVTNGSRRLVIGGGTQSGQNGVGVTSPTAKWHIAAGTATAGTAPLKLTSGVNLTTPENGAFEFDGTHFYATVGTTRYQLDNQTSNVTEYKLSALNTAPISSTDTGTLGEIRFTATYIYVCTATNTWIKTKMMAWTNSPILCEVKAGTTAATTAGIVVGATTYINSLITDSQVEVTINNINVPSLDHTDGTLFYSKTTSSNTITFSAAIVTGDWYKIRIA
ncbi:MAG: right-handed parallel beta-helix repeat-containing protein [Bacteroidota bacterium]|nr:right-handed parallel beta-helix repeat-containing protein [Bacteroidota bacterium]